MTIMTLAWMALAFVAGALVGGWRMDRRFDAAVRLAAWRRWATYEEDGPVEDTHLGDMTIQARLGERRRDR